MAIGGGAEGRCGGEQALVVGVLVAELDQVGAAGERGLEQRGEGRRVVPGLADEVEAGLVELLGWRRHRAQA